jgi:hypothetical protein
MIRGALAFIIFLHGLIHLMGFARAFRYGNISLLSMDISRTVGVVWLFATSLFVTAGVLLLLKKESWWMIILPAVILSQVLIVTVWGDAKFGTVINAVLFLIVVLLIESWRFEQVYRRDVAQSMQNISAKGKEVITEKDLQHLPLPVQKYLRYVGVVGKPRVYNYKISFNGQMRERGKYWFSFTSEQYNFTSRPTRLFFMKAKMYGVTVPGYHAYKEGKASMQIKPFGLFPIINEKEGVLDKAETVTIFNDMCIFAPATLIHPFVQWQTVDSLTAKATFTVKELSISAVLYFNGEGQLIDFISDDRYAIADKKQYRFSTPVSQYRSFHGYCLPSYGEAVWHYPDGKFAYGRFHTADVQYNIQ